MHLIIKKGNDFMITPTKDLILQTSFRLFRDKGYNSVTLNDICKECELTKSAFYYHFDSKENLLLHYYDQAIAKLQIEYLKHAKTANYWEQVWTCFSTLLQASLELGPDLTGQLFISNILREKGTFSFNHSFAELCISLIEQAQKAGQIQNAKPAAELFQAASFLFTGYEIMWCIKDGTFDREKMVRQSLEIIFDVPEKYCLTKRIDPAIIFDI